MSEVRQSGACHKAEFRTALSRVLLAALTWGGGAAMVRAEEKPGAAAAASAETSISAAKRDLEAIKSVRGPLSAPPAEMPKLSAPELQIGRPGPATQQRLKRERTAKEQLEAQKRSKNWLLEAMERERRIDGAESAGRRSRMELESERALAAREQLRSEESELEDPFVAALEEDAAARDAERKRERKPETPPANPLAGFMADWMTPQDFALLQPNRAATSGGSGPDLGDVVNAAADNAALASVSPPGADLAAIFDSGKASAAEASSGRENPYLQTLAAPNAFENLSAQIPTFHTPAPAIPPVSSAPVFTPVPPPEPPAAKSKVPDFVKPTDDKYFKQLKRF